MPVNGFKTHAADLRAMLDASWFANFDATKRADVASAAADVLRLIPGLPGSLAATGGLVTWTLPIAAPDQRAGFAAGWGERGPTLRLSAENIHPANAPLEGTVTIELGPGGLDAAVRVQVLLDSIGVAASPTLRRGTANRSFGSLPGARAAAGHGRR